MKKIIIVTTAWFGGGAETVARESYDYLTKSGFDCYFACSRGDAPSNVKQIKIGNKLDLLSHATIARIFDGAGRGSKIATINFINTIKKINPDIVLLHNIVCYTLNIRLFFSFLRESNLKVIWTLHDCWSFTGHCGMLGDGECDSWRNGCKCCKGKLLYPKSVFLSNSRKNLIIKQKYIGEMKNLYLITPSKWLSNLIKQTYLSKFDTYVINNGINTELFHPVKSNIKKKHNISEQKIILGVASRWERRKGLKYFVELDKYINHEKYIIVLIGVNEQQVKELPEDIYTIKRTNNVEELVEWYSSADFFVNPTLADNFPTVNLEALACGTPVITFDTGGSWESVGEECGELVLEKNGKALMKAIMICESKNIMSETCRQHALKYDTNSAYQKYANLIKKLI